MSRTANRRCNKRLRRIHMLKAKGKISETWKYDLLSQWEREIEFRAHQLFCWKGDCRQGVWDLFNKKRQEAMALEVDDDLREICRQAIARHMGPRMAWLGRPMLPTRELTKR